MCLWVLPLAEKKNVSHLFSLLPVRNWVHCPTLKGNAHRDVNYLCKRTCVGSWGNDDDRNMTWTCVFLQGPCIKLQTYHHFCMVWLRDVAKVSLLKDYVLGEDEGQHFSFLLNKLFCRCKRGFPMMVTGKSLRSVYSKGTEDLKSKGQESWNLLEENCFPLWATVALWLYSQKLTQGRRG